MTGTVPPLEPGLYLVATPIGAARDITLRALDVLAAADVLAAEDTRTLRHLMDIHGIALHGRSVLPYHDHNGDRVRPKILAHIAAGRSVAYASDAGTPLIADPGYRLGRAVAEAGHRVTTAPGATAAIAALTLSGLPTDRFLFAGFPPATSAARRAWLDDLREVHATLVFYESPKRLAASLDDMAAVLGADRPAAVCRELTKRFEETLRAPLAQLAETVRAHPPKGEIVVVVGRSDRSQTTDSGIEDALREAMQSMTLKDAAAVVAEAFGQPRRRVYQLALAMAAQE